MNAARFSVILLFLTFSCAISLQAQSRLQFEQRQFGSIIRLQPRVLVHSVVPDHYLEASANLKDWRVVGSVPGGIRNGPFVHEFPSNTGERMQYFRVREHLNVVGANLRGVHLDSEDHRGANLPWAQLNTAILVNTDFSGANLQHATLRDAVLSGAAFQDANLCYADLLDATIEPGTLAGAALLNTRMPDGTFVTDDLLAESIALDLSAELTAPAALYLRIRRDLAAIRAIVPEGVPSSARFEWGIPNGIHVWATQQQFAALNGSELGPVSYITNQPNKIAFAKTFHPRALAMALYSRFGVGQTEEFLFLGNGGDKAKAELGSAVSTYTFTIRWGDCLSGCLYSRTTIVSITSSGEVEVLSPPYWDGGGFPPWPVDLPIIEPSLGFQRTLSSQQSDPPYEP